MYTYIKDKNYWCETGIQVLTLVYKVILKKVKLVFDWAIYENLADAVGVLMYVFVSSLTENGGGLSAHRHVWSRNILCVPAPIQEPVVRWRSLFLCLGVVCFTF